MTTQTRGKKGDAAVTRLRRPPMSDEQKAAEKADPSLKFRRLANKRVNAAIKSLRSVGNLAGSAYSKGRLPENIEAILNALGTEFAGVRAAFLKTKAEDSTFGI